MINYQRDEVVEKITRVRNTLAIYEDEWDKEMELLNEALELLGAIFVFDSGEVSFIKLVSF